MATIAAQHEWVVKAFDAFRHDPAFASGGGAPARQRALDQFLDRGFPTTREEEWKFTSVAPIAERSFARAPIGHVTAEELAPFLIPGLPTAVIVNGRVSRELSAKTWPAGVSVETRHTATGGHPASDLIPKAGSTARAARPVHPFVALNEAFAEDQVFLRVEPKAVVQTPIHVLSLTTADAASAMVLPRLVVAAGEQSEVSIVESYAGLGAAISLTSAWTELQIDAGAVVSHVKIQREAPAAFHLGSTAVWLERGATFASRATTFGGRIARNDITAILEGDGAECTLNGLYIAMGHAVADTHTTIEHRAPHCPSHEVYKGILAGHARAVFNGKIIVDRVAQKTDAKQTNKALLLSDDAQINTKPQLEIFADDVKCTHGAAIGQLDEDAMFYLRARGIAEIDARNLLIHAFAGEVLDGIAHETVRDVVVRLMEEKLSLPH